MSSDFNRPYLKVQENMENVGDAINFGSSAPPYTAQPISVITTPAVPMAGPPIMPQALNYNPSVGPSSTELTCPQCKSRIKTKVRHRSTMKTHCMCLLLFWTGCCCCIPYCMDSCRKANHFCPMCGCYIGSYE